MTSKKRRLVNNLEANRAKQMMRLYDRYRRIIETPGMWDINYNWRIYYYTANGPYQAEFTSNTENIAFTAMIFEATLLPTTVHITKMQLIGFLDE